MKKLQSNAKYQLVVSEASCDRCGVVMPTHDAEFRESLSIDSHCGGGSIFGKGKKLRLDLCQSCVKEVLGEWIQVQDPISPDQIERLAEFVTLVQHSFSNNQAAIDEWLDIRSSDLGGESPNAFFERTGETEPIINLLRNLH